jgi:hypothetical protein
MNREITAFPPGRALDALVAEHVMGLMVKPITFIDGRGPRPERGTVGKPYKMADGRMGVSALIIPSYSTEMAAAWEVVEKITQSIVEAKEGQWWLDGLGFNPDDTSDPRTDRWRCWFTSERGGARIEASAEADTAPLAICLAALRAVGVQETPTHE